MPLKRWCYRNRNRVYFPEWLLAEWGMQVELYFGAGIRFGRGDAAVSGEHKN